MIDPKTLKQLVRLMVEHDLTELDLQEEGQKVSIKRGLGQSPQVSVMPAPAAPVASPAGPGSAGTSNAPPAAADEGLTPIESPMVGTFYSASSPDAKPFVSVGDTVDEDTVVCIIEAMKVFNEIKAGVKGTIAKTQVSNGQAVEYGQPLFHVKPQ